MINIFYGRLSPKDDFKLTMIVEATNKRTKQRFERFHDFFFENPSDCLDFVEIVKSIV